MHRRKINFSELHPQVALAGKTPMLTLKQRHLTELIQLGGRVMGLGDSGSKMQEHQERLADALAGCAKGDRNALRTIFELEGATLVAVAQRILRRRDLAEDVVQEAFIQIWTKAGQYAPDRGSARGWIYAIARNRALNLVRDGKRLEFTEPDNLADLHDAEHMDHAANVWADLDRQNRLRECLSRLDETKRRSILMVYISGYTHGEIAGRLKVPLGTAKAWVRRGLASLRECMA
jgi:RNA polymerase sigma-70 factor (ECF subfamily)